MAAKTRTGSATTFAVASGAEMPRNWGSSSPKTIEKTVASTRARALDTALDRAGREPEGREGAGQEAADRGLGQRADDERRDRDADLRRGQLRRELGDRLEHDPGARVTLVDGALDRRAVDRDERELGGDEDGRAGGEQHRDEQQEPLGHGCTRPAGGWRSSASVIAPHYREPTPVCRVDRSASRVRAAVVELAPSGSTRRGPEEESRRGSRRPRAHRSHRGARTDQALRLVHRRRPPRLRRRARPDHRVPRPQRRRQDDDAAHAARPRTGVRGHGDHRRPALRRHPRPADGRRGRARGDDFHPGRTGRNHLRVQAPPPASRPARRRGARAGRHPRRRAQAGGRLLDGHAPAPRPRRALLGDPHVLLLDEPANGLDPEGIRWLRGFLRHLADEGRTLLISSHMLSEVEQTVDDVVIIANGKRVAQGTVDELRGEPTAYVRTSDPDRLTAALQGRGLRVTPKGAGLQVTTEDLAVVGDVAHASDVAIHELRSEQTHLEELFFTLTESEGDRNRLTGAGGAVRRRVPGPRRRRRRPQRPRDLPADLPPPSGPPVVPAAVPASPPTRRRPDDERRHPRRVPQVLHHASLVGHGDRHDPLGGRLRRPLRPRLHQRRRPGAPRVRPRRAPTSSSPRRSSPVASRSATC